jgi:sortase A
VRRYALAAAALAALLALGGLVATTAAAPDPPAPAGSGAARLDATTTPPASAPTTTVPATTTLAPATTAARATATTAEPATTAGRPATTVAPSTTAPAPAAPEPLPVPDTVPADPYADVPTPAIGTIVIPAIGLQHTIYEGVTLTAIDQGPGHWPGTALPGQLGNAVFGGHRTTHSHPFLDVDRLVVGDEIVFEMADGGRHVYRVTEQFVVDPVDGMWIVDQVRGHIVTLFACHPKGSAAQRIVIRGELVT